MGSPWLISWVRKRSWALCCWTAGKWPAPRKATWTWGWSSWNTLWDYREGEKLRRRLQEGLAGLFTPVALHLLLLEEENPHVQHAAIAGIQVYVLDEEVAREYRRKVWTLYADWHSWW